MTRRLASYLSLESGQFTAEGNMQEYLRRCLFFPYRIYISLLRRLLLIIQPNSSKPNEVIS